MDNNYGHPVNLRQYRRLDGKWQFVPVVKQNGKPTPELVLINGKPVSSKGGILYLGLAQERQAPHSARRLLATRCPRSSEVAIGLVDPSAADCI
jgi:hypothetical protein